MTRTKHATTRPSSRGARGEAVTKLDGTDAGEPDLPGIVVEERAERWLTWRRDGSSLLECRSHAIADEEGRVWVIDPLDGAGLDDQLAELGPVAGVIVLLDRHVRDSVQVAERHDVPLYAPAGSWRPGHPMPKRATPYTSRIAGCHFSFVSVVHRSGQWLERALWWPQQRLLVVADAVGTPDYYLSRSREPLGVHPVLRVIQPPRRLLELEPRPQHILFGHGPSLHEQAGASLELAITEARRELPWFALAAPRHAIRWARAAFGVQRASC